MDEVMVTTHTASLHGLAAHTLPQLREASQRWGEVHLCSLSIRVRLRLIPPALVGNPQTYLPPKQARRNRRLKATVAVTASQVLD